MRFSRWLWGAVLAAGTVLTGCETAETAYQGPWTDDPTQAQFYPARVRPIFVKQCGHCHFGMSHKGGLGLSTKAAILKGGKNGAVIVPGDPDASLLVKMIRHQPGVKPMPDDRKLSDAEIDTISRWIKAGALIPDDPGR